ncbi:hypothetical protein Aph01nite_74830 [Acrocarpospora phusangensis]|uniref:Uncharacterized protein n=1 Tax=Acrocarpospora phusangensis TaxID=1070424 RepID=A0A919QK55_9ACTN|nr:hypothetical protein [Acrocarpospora phusangensis]GIH29173.1 hypothetical protein Aph01nite_74830 [Acrocarpospora phusangensis]
MDHSNHTLLQAGSQAAISDRMRELLARAAQDHVYEQRTQGAVLDEIRQRLEGMEWLLREVRERELGGLSGTMEAVNGRLDDITNRPPAWAEGLAQHVEMVRDHVDAVNERVAGVGDRVTPIAELPSLWADVGTVGESVDEALTRLASVLDGTQHVTDRMVEFTKRLGQLQASMEAAANRFTRLDKVLGELAQRTERLEGGVLDLTANLGGAVEAAADRVSAAVDQVAERVSEVESRQAAAGTRLDRLDTGLASVTTGLATVGEGLTTVTAGLATVSEGQSATGAQFHALEGQVAGVTARLDRIDGRIETADECLADIDTRMSGVESRLGGVDARLATVDGHLGRHDERFTTLDERVNVLDESLRARFTALDEQVAERLDGVDDRVEAVSQRVGQLPATLEISELHKNLGDLSAEHAGRFDTVERRLAEAADALTPLITARPDHGQLTETLTKTLTDTVEPAQNDMTRRLGALEETMLALAEALLRPTRTGKD